MSRPSPPPEGGYPLQSQPGDSMDLLQNLIEHSLDDDYYAVSERTERQPSKGARAGTVTVVAVFALLVVVAAVQTRIELPESQSERATLVSQINEQKGLIADKQDESASIRRELRVLRQSNPDTAALNRIRDERISTGAVAVAGGGVQIVVNNAEGADDDARGRVLDKDLQVLVNGLWLAGAEAISINDNRLTSLSSIRTAGEAITVNYKSLTPPYVVRAIGDSRTLEARFLETPAGESWSNLENNFGLRFETEVRSSMTLPAAPTKRRQVRFAEPLESDS